MHRSLDFRAWKALPVILLLGSVLISMGGGQFSPSSTSGPADSNPIQSSGIWGFRPVTAEAGWLLLSNRLYWSSDAGNSWQEITPPGSRTATIAAIDFIDRAQGWALLAAQASGDPVYSLDTTVDGGHTWQSEDLPLFAGGDPAANAKAVYMQWLDDHTGWLVIQQATGVNFSLGSLFRTTDGGRHWTKVALPIGAPVSFVTSSVGWVAGGAAGHQLYRTQDGGRTWQAQAVLPASLQADQAWTYLTPTFSDVRHGLLPVTVTTGGLMQVDFFRTEDGGASWSLDKGLSLASSGELGTPPPLAVLDPDHWILLAPHTNSILVKTGPGQYATVASADGRSGGILEMHMATPQVGWASQMEGDCSRAVDAVCSLTARLMGTRDGGRTWTPLGTQGIRSLSSLSAFSPRSGNGFTLEVSFDNKPADSTASLAGAGFDECEIGTLSQLQSWWNSGPYATVNLYIGGSARACPNTALTPYYLTQLHQQGWKFVPTWVGPQAPCSSFASRISSNTTTAYSQGISQADLALAAAASLSLTDPAQTSTVIYYDLESYNTSNTSCRSAVQSFMNGWVKELNAKSDLAGVYGSPCSSALTDFLKNHYTPDAIWIARWNLSSYSSTATVWGGSCITDSDWANHQRIRQYAGDHTETWGGVSMVIDSDVLDGIVAVPYQGPGPTSPPGQPTDPKPTDGTTNDRTFDTTMYWNTNAIYCTMHIWGGSIDIHPTIGCSSYHLGQQYGGAYSWQVTVGNSYGNTTGPIWHFNIRPQGSTGLSAKVVSASQINLAWTLSTDEPANIDAYDVYINSQYIASLPHGTTSTSVSGLTCGTTYSFLLRSKRQNVQSLDSNTVNAKTSACVPGAFGKISPADGAPAEPTDETLTWGSSATATSYQYCYDTVDNDSCDGTWTSTTSTSAALTGLVAGTTYYWQVQAVNSSGMASADGGTWWSFTPSDTPATVTPSLTPTITAVPSITSTPTRTPTTVPSITPTPTVTPTSQPGAPGYFGKINPANGAGGVGMNVVLSWGSSSGVALYLYCLDTVNDNRCNTAWTVTYTTSASVSGLSPGMTYYWEVEAVKPPGATLADNGTWWSFSPSGVPGTVLPGATFTPTLTPAQPTWTATRTPTSTVTPTPTSGGITPTVTSLPGGPGAFGKIHPANGAKGVGSNGTLSWGASSGAALYLVCYDTINDDRCNSAWTVTYSTSLTTSGVSPGITYYWEVEAVKPPGSTLADNGTWWSFTP